MRNGTRIAKTFCLFLRSPITRKFDLIKKKATVEFAISTLPTLIHIVSHFSWDFSQEKLKTQ